MTFSITSNPGNSELNGGGSRVGLEPGNVILEQAKRDYLGVERL